MGWIRMGGIPKHTSKTYLPKAYHSTPRASRNRRWGNFWKGIESLQKYGEHVIHKHKCVNLNLSLFDYLTFRPGFTPLTNRPLARCKVSLVKYFQLSLSGFSHSSMCGTWQVKYYFDTYLRAWFMSVPVLKIYTMFQIGHTNEQILGLGDSEIYRSMMFLLIFNLFSTVINLPFSIYGTFVLEEKHGFNQQTAAFYIKDQIKAFFVGQAIMLPLVAAIIKIIMWGGTYFFVYLWGFVTVFSLFMLIVYPEFIAPLFDKYVPLPEGQLRLVWLIFIQSKLKNNIISGARFLTNKLHLYHRL